MSGTPADAFPKFQFGDVAFPYTDYKVRGGSRHAPHEFPHAPGEEIEKLGRKAYRISVRGTFHDVPGSALDRNFPNLYPVGMRKLREYFEQELTKDLVIPSIGTIQAYATDWEQMFKPTTTTGENFDIEFIEDQNAATLVGIVIELGNPQALLAANDNLQATAALADFNRPATVSFFQQINDAVTQFQAVSGQSDAFSQLVAAKIEAISSLCQYGDTQLQDLQDPMNHVVIDAMKDLWLSSKQLANNVIQTRAEIRSFIVPKLMAVQQVAQAIRARTGFEAKAEDVLQLNAFEDALAIPAGTSVKYIAA